MVIHLSAWKVHFANFAQTAFSEVAFLALGDAPIFTGCHYATAGKGIDPLRQEGREGEA